MRSLRNDFIVASQTAELKKSLANAHLLGVDVRAIVVINPGNPTGQCLSEQNIREIIDFCHKERIVIMADEVYQTNIYNDKFPFHSFRKVLKRCVLRIDGDK